ncbi:hypothetical protein [Brucella anthropi]|uniref:TackOD1 domain-containing metal-binding protein n=1 Tax=Brucella anthropi TaxID=529 RepID=UPI00398822CD
MALSPVPLSSGEASIASPETLAQQVRFVWNEVGLTWKPKIRWFPRQPEPLNAVFSILFEPGAGDDVDTDAVLFSDERRSSPLHNIRDFVGGMKIPMVDLRGRAGDFADCHFDLMEPQTWRETARCIVKYSRGREALAPLYRQSIDPENELLAHIFVSGRQLRGMRYPLAPEAVCYPGFFSANRVIPIAERLVSKGFLKKTFFDRLYECKNCQSRRLSVREECPDCRSADIRETSLIHHFSCASVLPEERFRQGMDLVCPKCKQLLRNYGKDYDRAGQAFICNACDSVSSELEVGFICLDCNGRMNGEAAERVDIHHYSLTDMAQLALTGKAVPGNVG